MSTAALRLEFSDETDLMNFCRYAEKAKSTEGTVAGLYSGLACSAVKRAKVIHQTQPAALYDAAPELLAALKRAEASLQDIRANWQPIPHPKHTPETVAALEGAIEQDHIVVCEAIAKAGGAL